jgi:hypothetical protein
MAANDREAEELRPYALDNLTESPLLVARAMEILRRAAYKAWLSCAPANPTDRMFFTRRSR